MIIIMAQAQAEEEEEEDDEITQGHRPASKKPPLNREAKTSVLIRGAHQTIKNFPTPPNYY